MPSSPWTSRHPMTRFQPGGWGGRLHNVPEDQSIVVTAIEATAGTAGGFSSGFSWGFQLINLVTGGTAAIALTPIVADATVVEPTVTCTGTLVITVTAVESSCVVVDVPLVPGLLLLPITAVTAEAKAVTWTSVITRFQPGGWGGRPPSFDSRPRIIISDHALGLDITQPQVVTTATLGQTHLIVGADAIQTQVFASSTAYVWLDVHGIEVTVPDYRLHATIPDYRLHVTVDHN